MVNNKLNRVGWGKLGSNGETIIFYDRPEEEVFPIYLDLRSHNAMALFIGQELEFTGYLTLNIFDEKVRSGHITPVNIALLNHVKELLIADKAKQEVLTEIKTLFSQSKTVQSL